ncbi:hypothetical protein BCR34DRAFT_580403 [Clohesyomyces aquaticus]|uniref:Uncharacterized protein n=1 Tax=Clohesyomyces aquaticus TaxID=1231657 RepID=A0A1Y1Y6F6_9PLEO|nr:hypothetical protein BCR34DRAFT_580403 [Clohesyomyces aquaticus]
MEYNVYRIETHLGMQDPLMPPGPRFHNAIYVETAQNGGGRIIQVTGVIADAGGMYFEEKYGERPEGSDDFHRKHFLGQIQSERYMEVVQLMRSVPAPPRQRVFDARVMGHVPCKPDGSKYEPGEMVPPYMKCTEWTLGLAIPALQKSGLLNSTRT